MTVRVEMPAACLVLLTSVRILRDKSPIFRVIIPCIQIIKLGFLIIDPAGIANLVAGVFFALDAGLSEIVVGLAVATSPLILFSCHLA